VVRRRRGEEPRDDRSEIVRLGGEREVPAMVKEQLLLLAGGPTVTGMLPPDEVPDGQGFLEPAVTGPPIVWPASDDAAGVHDERIVAAELEHWLRDRNSAR
jgi:hypothetical protein